VSRRSIHVEGLAHQNPIPVASRVGNILASSVISPVDPATGSAPPTLAEQCAVVFANMRRILGAAGASPEDVVKVSVFMIDPSQRAAINEHWLEMFPDEDSRPARHTQHDTLIPPRLVALEFLAVLDA
jgi:2-iminobutanoate/2-iminopropanoate deaminase